MFGRGWSMKQRETAERGKKIGREGKGKKKRYMYRKETASRRTSVVRARWRGVRMSRGRFREIGGACSRGAGGHVTRLPPPTCCHLRHAILGIGAAKARRHYFAVDRAPRPGWAAAAGWVLMARVPIDAQDKDAKLAPDRPQRSPGTNNQPCRSHKSKVPNISHFRLNFLQPFFFLTADCLPLCPCAFDRWITRFATEHFRAVFCTYTIPLPSFLLHFCFSHIFLSCGIFCCLFFALN